MHGQITTTKIIKAKLSIVCCKNVSTFLRNVFLVLYFNITTYCGFVKSTFRVRKQWNLKLCLNLKWVESSHFGCCNNTVIEFDLASSNSELSFAIEWLNYVVE